MKHHYGDQIKENKITGTCVACGEQGNVYETSFVKAVGKTLLREHKRRREDEIKIVQNEI